jgi:molecular chaperone DnaJ
MTFKEAVLGCTKKIKINRRVRCEDCGGEGETQLHDSCETCNGRGQIIQQSGNGTSTFVYAQTCPTCLGAGKKSLKCGMCEGKGGIEKDSELDVKIRGGLTNGNVVRLQGAGHYVNIMGSHAAGLVHISVNVEVIPNMRLHGRDVISTIDVPLLEALKGVTKKVQTIDGESEIKVRPEAKHKDQIRLKGFGVERKGDHVFNLNVQYPKDTTPLIDLLEKE